MKKKNIEQKIVIFSLCGLVGLFIVLLILTLVLDNNVGNYLLLFNGLLDLSAAFILYKIVAYRERYICPECGTKRIHHRVWTNTSEKVYSRETNGQNPYRTTEYTHFYIDTYRCPNCGETMTENISKSGGKISEYANGMVQDHRIPPREI